MVLETPLKDGVKDHTDELILLFDLIDDNDELRLLFDLIDDN